MTLEYEVESFFSDTARLFRLAGVIQRRLYLEASSTGSAQRKIANSIFLFIAGGSRRNSSDGASIRKKRKQIATTFTMAHEERFIPERQKLDQLSIVKDYAAVPRLEYRYVRIESTSTPLRRLSLLVLPFHGNGSV
jgi:hypothetical protein